MLTSLFVLHHDKEGRDFLPVLS